MSRGPGAGWGMKSEPWFFVTRRWLLSLGGEAHDQRGQTLSNAPVFNIGDYRSNSSAYHLKHWLEDGLVTAEVSKVGPRSVKLTKKGKQVQPTREQIKIIDWYWRCRASVEAGNGMIERPHYMRQKVADQLIVEHAVADRDTYKAWLEAQDRAEEQGEPDPAVEPELAADAIVLTPAEVEAQRIYVPPAPAGPDAEDVARAIVERVITLASTPPERTGPGYEALVAQNRALQGKLRDAERRADLAEANLAQLVRNLEEQSMETELVATSNGGGTRIIDRLSDESRAELAKIMREAPRARG